MMRLSHTRIISQLFFLGLFLLLIGMTTFGSMKSYPVSMFLYLDPLVAFAAGLATHTVYGGMILALVLLVATMALGRFFCGWVCPLGTLNEFAGRIGGRKDKQQAVCANQYRGAQAVKYYVLAAILILALFGVLQLAFDPIVLLTRSMSVSVMPAVGNVAGGAEAQERYFRYGWLFGGVLLAVLLLNAARPRFWCRTVCPLGAFLGAVSRLNVFHVHRSVERCINCNLCAAKCEGAADPNTRLRKAECFVCMNCREVCPTQAITFKFMPPERSVKPGPDVNRRRLLTTAACAAVAVPLLRASVRSEKQPSPSLIRPPGSLPEEQFLAACTRCGACMKVCPTNVIQPAMMESDIEGLWTPVMVNRSGYCEYNCNLCGQVCPTGAISRFSVDEKLGQPPHERPIKIGTAFVDRTRCLPWAEHIPCIVCEEMCPVSPKAIYIETAQVVNSTGKTITVQRPVVDPARCIGCGLCENRCPVYDKRGIRVTSVGETRSKRNVLLLPPSAK